MGASAIEASFAFLGLLASICWAIWTYYWIIVPAPSRPGGQNPSDIHLSSAPGSRIREPIARVVDSQPPPLIASQSRSQEIVIQETVDQAAKESGPHEVLIRAGFVLQSLFYEFRQILYPQHISEIGHDGGALQLKGRGNDDCFYEFPETAFADGQDRDAALAFFVTTATALCKT